MIKKEYKDLLIQIIKRYVPNAKIYLFGSRARQTNTPGSDIDLAIQAPEKIHFRIIQKILNDIEASNIPFLVDIVDINDAPDNLKKLIEKDKVLWSN